MITENKRLIGILASATLLLFIPLTAMLFTNEVNWGAMDFAIAGILLFGTGLGCELVLRKVKKTSYRLLICGIIFLLLFLIWAELAVDLFGTPLAGS